MIIVLMMHACLVDFVSSVSQGDMRVFRYRGDVGALKGFLQSAQGGEFFPCEGSMKGECEDLEWIFYSWGYLDRSGEPPLVQCGPCGVKEAEYYDAKYGVGWDEPMSSRGEEPIEF